MSKRTEGDVSRRRRFADLPRMTWYALHRARRFARRIFGEPITPDSQKIPALHVLDQRTAR